MLEQAMGCAASYARARAEAEKPPWPANPFPKGIRCGSASEKILRALVQAHPRWMEHWELMRVTGRSRGAVCWGIRYLAESGLLRSIPSARHPSYRRYQAILGADKQRVHDE